MLRPLKILLLEDEPDDVEFARRALSSFKLVTEVTVASNLEEAEKHLASGTQFDLLLIDYLLPDGSGLDLLKKTASGNPVKLVLTGNSDPDVIRAVSQTGADYMPKPLAPAPLVDLLRANNFWMGFSRPA